MGEEDRKKGGIHGEGDEKGEKGRKYREERCMRGEMRRWGYWGKGWNKEN